MKKTCFIALLIFCVADIFAQECIVRKNKLGFNLYFSEFDLNSFEKKFGIKYWLSDRTALRSILEFSTGETTSEYLDQFIDEDSFDFSLYLEYHIYKNKKLTPYFGFGAELGITKIYNDNLSPQWRNREIYHRNSHQFSFNIPLGIECQPFKYLSLAIQYNIYLTIKNYEDKTEYILPDGIRAYNYKKFQTKNFAFNEFYLILAIYF